MKIHIITPAPPKSRAGNRTTAARWASLLRALGHKITISVEYHGQVTDLMIALHAWRSAAAITKFKEQHSNLPLILAITGTDAYRFIHSHPETTLNSIACADRLVGLHDLIGETIPVKHRHKLRVIYQSAQPVKQRQPLKRSFRICVAGHLRDEKDPLRPAYAVRSLPKTSRIKIDQFGKAHTAEWGNLAIEEMKNNPRYRWHGEVTHSVLRKKYSRAHLLVLPSRMEGGANVISEAVTAKLPVIASSIAGSIGLLGSEYPGYYEVENTEKLREQLLLAESSQDYYQSLQRACNRRRHLFTPEQEKNSWQQLLQEMQL